MPSLFDLGEGQSWNLGRYEVSRKIGEGRFSVVFRAYDTRNSQDVALKVYVGTDERALARGESESQTLKKLGELNSPFFPKFKGAIKTLIENTSHRLLVLELGEYADPTLPAKSVLTVKDILEAASRGDLVESHLAFWAPEALQAFCIDLFQAVADLHSLGIIHRDIKPSNVLLKRAAGSDRIYPFILDFNAVSDSSSDTAGSKNYLPPEVTYGTRVTADKADDLWASCRLVWELFFGEGSPVNDNPRPHSLAPATLAGTFLPVLRKGLATQPEHRFPDALTMRDRAQAAFSVAAARPANHLEPEPKPPTTENSPTDTPNFYGSRAAEERIRLNVIYTLETSDTPPIPKEMRELVAMTLETCADGSSTAIDLKSDLSSLGAAAFPAILEQCYKLPLFSPEWDLCHDALLGLSLQDQPLAIRSLSYYCVSSSYAVRHLCMELCKQLDVLPVQLVDLFAKDSILLDHDERQRLLELIFAHAKDDSVFFWLVSHMTKQLIADPTRYMQLRGSIAHRLGTLPGDQHAAALKAFADERHWTRMPAYKTRHPEECADTDMDILRLVAEGFSCLAKPIDCLVQWHPDVQRNRTARPWTWKVWLEFMKKTLVAMPDSERVFRDLATRSYDADLLGELDRLRNRAPLSEEEAPEVFRQYLDGEDDSRHTFNRLRFDRTGAVITLLRTAFHQDLSHDECDRCLELLEGFQSRVRVRVVDCVLDNWQTLKAHDLQRACDVLTQAPLHPGRALDRAVAILNDELRETGDPHVRETLAKLLS
jgi:serine/threonine protein kinase